MIDRSLCAAGAAIFLLSACSNDGPSSQTNAPSAETIDKGSIEERSAAPIDRFTYANYNDVRVRHVDLNLEVDFERKVLNGAATLDLEYLQENVDTLVLDTNDLAIDSVEAFVGGEWRMADHALGEDDQILGARLDVTLPAGTTKVRIAYETSPGAEGLQWLTPEQTAGKEYPFLFSQNQPIHARTMAPLQDTPAVRMTYTARIRTPPALTAIMSAAQDPDGVRDGDYFFDMPQPIPSYLLAIAVGDFGFKAINDHIGVYAETYILDRAAAEFEDTPLMEEANERLYGPYRWGRFDMIVLPPSFPFGGMENPRLTFLTPTLIAGDKSLTNVVAHELAHSWSGNLVTNATWRDAWLNEGFTSYVENRIMEDLYGERRATMERALDLQSLKRDISEAPRPQLTALKMPDDIRHPDEAFSQISYAGGMFFLKFLEERFGREDFDAFLKKYFNEFAFKAITTEDFLDYFETNLVALKPDAVTKDEINAWIYEPGLPDTAPTPVSEAFAEVTAQQDAWLNGGDVSGIEPDIWSTHEWLHFINTLPEDVTDAQFAALDNAFKLSSHANAEIAFAWYMQAIARKYEPAQAPLGEFFARVGRGKFIYRLYAALKGSDWRPWGEDVYGRTRAGYHPIAQRRIDGIFKSADEPDQ